MVIPLVAITLHPAGHETATVSHSNSNSAVPTKKGHAEIKSLLMHEQLTDSTALQLTVLLLAT